MEIGQIVKVRAYGGEELIRCVVRIDKGIVVVCRPDEYKAAQVEEREPMGVGFHKTDIIDDNLGD